MYVKYFNFNGKPFGINPDPRFFFNSKTHKQALSTLGYGLGQGQGFIIITGDAGTGKTMVMSALQHMLAKTNIVTARIINTQLDSNEMLRYVAAELGLPYEDLSKVSLLKSIESFLQECQSKDKRVVIIVDEAQSLSDSAIDELRMLMNLVSDKDSLLQFVLFGQTRLKEQLYTEIFEPLRQRIVGTYHLESFNEKETKAYILHRLRTVGWIGNPDISPDAFIVAYEYSQGIPAKINMLCEKVLQAACLNGSDLVQQGDVQNIIRELNNNFSDEHFSGSLVEGVIDQIIMERIGTPTVEVEPVLLQEQVQIKTAVPVEAQVKLAAPEDEFEIVETIVVVEPVTVVEPIVVVEPVAVVEPIAVVEEELQTEELQKEEPTETGLDSDSPTESVIEFEMLEEEIILAEPLVEQVNIDASVIEEEVSKPVVDEEIVEQDTFEEILEIEESDVEIVELELIEESVDEKIELELNSDPEDARYDLPELEDSGLELDESTEITEEITLGGSMFEEDHFVRPESMDIEVQQWLKQQKQKIEEPEQNSSKSELEMDEEFEFAMERTGKEHLNPFAESSLPDSLGDTIEEAF